MMRVISLFLLYVLISTVQSVTSKKISVGKSHLPDLSSVKSLLRDPGDGQLMNKITQIRSSSSHAVDTELYSRQLFVYGKNAQQQLQASKVLIVGSGSLVYEIAKNMVLTGIGHISIRLGDDASTSTNHEASLIGNATLETYLRELNPHVQVRCVHAA